MQNTSATPFFFLKRKQIEPAPGFCSFKVLKILASNASATLRGNELIEKKQISYNCNNYRNQTGNFIRQIFTRRGRSCSGWWFHFFSFHPYLGKIPILTNIFQMGWNHQLVLDALNFKTVSSLVLRTAGFQTVPSDVGFPFSSHWNRKTTTFCVSAVCKAVCQPRMV